MLTPGSHHAANLNFLHFLFTFWISALLIIWVKIWVENSNVMYVENIYTSVSSTTFSKLTWRPDKFLGKKKIWKLIICQTRFCKIHLCVMSQGQIFPISQCGLLKKMGSGCIARKVFTMVGILGRKSLKMHQMHLTLFQLGRDNYHPDSISREKA